MFGADHDKGLEMALFEIFGHRLYMILGLIVYVLVVRLKLGRLKLFGQGSRIGSGVTHCQAESVSFSILSFNFCKKELRLMFGISGEDGLLL